MKTGLTIKINGIEQYVEIAKGYYYVNLMEENNTLELFSGDPAGTYSLESYDIRYTPSSTETEARHHHLH